MNCNFKFGDKVKTQMGHTGVIVSIEKGQTGGYICTVEFDNKKLMPPQMKYPEGFLVYENKNQEVCPVCATRWSITKFNMKTWKDCKKCKKTYEELTSKDNDLLREFEKMLEEDDEEDTFFTF